MITIRERVMVPHSPDVVWSVLSDPPRVVACIEGSELDEYHDDGSFDARLAVKFAAIKVAFGATGQLDLVEEEHTGRIEARGSDTRGSTRVRGHMNFGVRPEAAGSAVDIDGAVEISGKLASLVTTGATVVVERMTRSFASRLTETCAELDSARSAPAAAVEPSGSSGGVLTQLRQVVRTWWTRLRRALAGRCHETVERG